MIIFVITITCPITNIPWFARVETPDKTHFHQNLRHRRRVTSAFFRLRVRPTLNAKEALGVEGQTHNSSCGTGLSTTKPPEPPTRQWMPTH
ncbi:hypothetical protein PoB_000229000 [Plakobranchus ocellatus]|uniref:Secreted protein n=1 Tax=Plakobranchus ocellatus TaxID=259542 RepID=A0AAV3XY86_9GAST|nr:hypothetical protein PoB_000229000 [Plakobranchus ocellatus]